METWAIVVVDLASAVFGFLSGLFAHGAYMHCKKSKVGDNSAFSGNIDSIVSNQQAGNNSTQISAGGLMPDALNKIDNKKI